MKLSLTNIITIGAAIALSAMPASARQLTPEEALATVSSSARKAPAISRGNLQLTHTFKSADAKMNTMYVFGRQDGKGFMLLSADDVAIPVLGYSDTETFSTENMPANLQAWLDNYSAQIAAAAAAGGKVLTAPARTDYVAISPLVKTKWNQNAPYNSKAPAINGTQCVTGCVATAIAQVINYHRWPDKGLGEVSYSWRNNTLSFDFANTGFEWDNMLDDYLNGGKTPTVAECDAVGTLMYAAGVAAHMDYGTQESGATEQYLVPALIDNMRYDKALYMANRDFYPLSEWVDMIYGELAASRPLFYTGVTINREGHAFVIDGYRPADGFFHLNWGWGGLSDGYYAITELNPDIQGIGGGSAGFIQGQSAIIGMKKSTAGSTYTPYFYCYGFGTDDGSYARNGYVNFTYGGAIINGSVAAMNTDIGVKLVNKTTNAVKYVWWYYGAKDIKAGTGYQDGLPFMASLFPTSGTYTVTPVVKVGQEIVDVRVHVSANPSLELQCSATTLKFTENTVSPDLEVVSLTQNGIYYPGKVAKLTAVIKNNGDGEYFNRPLMCGFRYGNSLFQFPNLVVTVGAGMTATYEFSGTLPTSVPAGKYDLIMACYDQSNQQLAMNTGGVQVEVVAKAEQGVLELVKVDFPDNTGGRGTATRPYTIPVNPANFNVDVKCTSGYFEGLLGLYLLTSSQEQVDVALSSPFTMSAGESKIISFTKPWGTQIQPNEKYIIRFFYGEIDNGQIDPIIFPLTTYVKLDTTAGLTDVADNDEPKIYPNPAADLAVVEMPDEISSVEVFSLGGSLVLSQPCDGTTATLDVASLPAGMYVVRVATADGVTTLRLIKN